MTRPTAQPGHPTPATRDRVGARQLAAGLAAGLLLAAVLVGLPLLLTVIAPLTVPGDVPGWRDALDVLVRRDDGSLLMLALGVLAWGAWLVMATSVLLEIVSVLRRRPTPRLPLLRVPQQGAAALVAAVVLALTPAGTVPGSTQLPSLPGAAHAAKSLPANLSGTSSRPAAAVAAVDLGAAPDGAARRTAVGSRPVAASGEGPSVRVRRHDTLWALAERHLGAGPRYREILALNLGRPQPDGRALTDAHWIYPGWVLRLPPDAVGAGGPARPAPPLRPPVIEAAAAAVDRGPVDEPGAGGPGGRSVVDRPGGRAPSSYTVPVAEATDVQVPGSSDIAPVLALGLGALTAGGVLAEVARQRRRRQGVRDLGERLPPAVRATVRAERMLRAVGDDGRGARVRAGLAHLAHACSRAGRALPDVAWVRVGATTLELVLGDDDVDVVPPFALTAPRTWSWCAAVEPAPDLGELADPYPALVSVGLDGDELVLVNLEAAGTLQVAGAPLASAAVMAAMTADLLGRNRSGAVTVSVTPGVLDVPMPAALARTVVSPAAAAARVEAHQDSVREVLGQCEVTDVRMARSAGVADETWVPEIVLGEQVAAAVAPWSGAAVVHGGGAERAGEWRLSPQQGELWRLDPPGIAVVPQRLEPEDQVAVADLLRAEPVRRSRAQVSLEPGMAGQVARARAALERVPARGPGDPGAPRVLLLGPVTVTGVDDAAAPGRSRRAAELVAYLVLHPGASRHELDEVLWPGRRVGRSTRNPFVSRTRQWLGRTPAGEAYLPLVAETGEYRLRDEITCDWNDFVALALRGTKDGEVDVGQLRDALTLVRGRPFQGIDPATYCWADPAVQEMVSAVVDVAHLLAAAAYGSGDPRTAAAAAARGLVVEPGSELLHRDALLAARELGDAEVERAVSRLGAALEDGDELLPQTFAVLDELGVHLDL